MDNYILLGAFVSVLLDSVVRGFASLCVAYMILCSSFAVVSLVRVSRAMGGVYGSALLWECGL
jgi:hypothetical protein